ncbi:NADH:quinone oxidoreductase [Pseudomonas ogarae]|uniref:NADH:quinone oxidoreductase n=1 Tax=Pseudomonas kilonensis TaxID=132476 RepID=A0A0F4XTM6_9PSED|nr:Rnf-Nqr domain containing protein [Pseudomonas ogarae]KKA09186.1 NADH:quinone oxidoreductase [Pseudomonas ogarae]OPG70582.1 NADH:quinone oxidoreductase [Pseudomonas ogarae]OPG81391.1 NADH:quinone oxidoreductase [Pseudomonas ogarae]PBJ13465.1 Na(+)-translocating NADH-quinone reductase subunit D [Pseudomonas ogarae]PBJ27012.1 Na(+)-translocating NADH-quinone reductase subunit D [Pseudomonas ogarae]
MNKPWGLTHGLLLVPLIGASDSLVGALGLWLAWALVLFSHGLAMGLVRQRLTACQRLLASIVLAATLATCTGLVVQAWALELYRPLSLYVGWIALSCVALEQEGFFVESRWPERLRLAGLFGLLMISLGAVRGLIGSGLPLALLAPGGFILLGLLLAARQAWTAARPHSSAEETPRP